MFWVDPKNDAFVVLLTNSVHPDGKGSVRRLRHGVSTLAAQALLGKAKPATVTPGIDVLKRDGFKPLKGKSVAVITNHTGIDREGNRLVDLLAAAPDVKLVKIFSPEHGLYGVLDEKVGHTVDEKTGLKVYSLYGETRRPTADMLEGVDAMVFDIQDIGARYYTYVSTMGLCMEEAGKRDIKFFVLDRPNPNGGLLVDGPVAQKKHFSFTAYGPIPTVHGMTAGELAKLFAGEFGAKCDLTVIPVEGWERRMAWEDTDLKWVNPSPNIRNYTQALLYLAIGTIEFSNVSVGRGTDTPFELFGAPWVDGEMLAAALNKHDLPGLRFEPIKFTPTSSRYPNQECGGVKVELTSRAAFTDPVRSGLTAAWEMRRLFDDAYKIEGVSKLLHNDDAMQALLTAKDPAKIPDVWKAELEAFRKVREKYLMYK